MSRPTIVCVSKTNSIYLNLNNILSYNINDNATLNLLKLEATKKSKEELTASDYEDVSAPTVFFFFIGGQELTFRAGHEISVSDYETLKKTLATITYELHERINNSEKPAKKAS